MLKFVEKIMYLVKANTFIQVETPKNGTHFYWSGWRPYQTREDKIYDKHEVWDLVAVMNGRSDVPEWAKRNITEFNKVVLVRDGKYALVNINDIQYLD